MLANKLLSCVGGEDKLWVEDCFSAYTYTGNGSTQTINNGIDLAGKGGLVWTKHRTQTYLNLLHDTNRGINNYLISSQTNAQGNLASDTVTSFNSTGFSIGTNNNVSWSGSMASWTFRKAPKFFLNTTVTKTVGSNATVDLSSLGTVGMVMVKRTDAAGSWYVFHRSATAGKLLYLEQTAEEATLGHITVSGTTLTLVNGVIADGSYVVYAWAHDSSADGIVQCGSFTTDGSANATVNLGWEPQFVLAKRADNTSSWFIFDTAREYSLSSYKILFPNLTDAEGNGAANANHPTANGFRFNDNTNGTYIYLAIRRPNKPPTVGTQVYNAIARTGTGAAATVTGVGFTPDLLMGGRRNGGVSGGFIDRLRGASRTSLSTQSTGAEANANDVTSFDMNGVTLGASAGLSFNDSGVSCINHFFKRAPGVFDVVCYTGTGAASLTVSHGLGATPEIIIVKGRNVSGPWTVYNTTLGNSAYINLHETSAKSTSFPNMWNSSTPTTTTFAVGNNGLNNSTWNYVSYLFATKAGISKVFSYTGNGSSQTVDCGFTTGARYVLVKSVSATGNWNVGDSTRGLTSGTDPLLYLNSTAAEITTDDWLDPTNVGFIVNETTNAHANVNGVTYIGLAIS